MFRLVEEKPEINLQRKSECFHYTESMECISSM